MSGAGCVVGIDFGTDSVRSIVADATNGDVLGTSVQHYPRWAAGLYCDPVENRVRQHPLDHLETMQASVVEALRAAGSGVAGRVRGIAVDTTGSTPVLADYAGRPLALTPPTACSTPPTSTAAFPETTTADAAAESTYSPPGSCTVALPAAVTALEAVGLRT